MQKFVETEKLYNIGPWLPSGILACFELSNKVSYADELKMNLKILFENLSSYEIYFNMISFPCSELNGYVT